MGMTCCCKLIDGSQCSGTADASGGPLEGASRTRISPECSRIRVKLLREQRASLALFDQQDHYLRNTRVSIGLRQPSVQDSHAPQQPYLTDHRARGSTARPWVLGAKRGGRYVGRSRQYRLVRAHPRTIAGHMGSQLFVTTARETLRYLYRVLNVSSARQTRLKTSAIGRSHTTKCLSMSSKRKVCQSEHFDICKMQRAPRSRLAIRWVACAHVSTERSQSELTILHESETWAIAESWRTCITPVSQARPLSWCVYQGLISHSEPSCFDLELALWYRRRTY